MRHFHIGSCESEHNSQNWGTFNAKYICVPKAVWFNSSAKFSGLAAKISFLKDTSSVITIHIDPLLQEQIPDVGGVMDECIKRIWRSRGVEGPRADRGLQVTEGMDSDSSAAAYKRDYRGISGCLLRQLAESVG